MKIVPVLAAFVLPALAVDSSIRPPGLRPLEAASHALTNARIVVKPGTVIEKGTVVLRDGRIVAVGEKIAIPDDARVHDLDGATVYAGFIDAHVSFAKSTREAPSEGGPPVNEDALTSGAAAPFLGVNSAAGGPGAKSVITPERRMAREHAPSQKSLEALRNEGFTAANVVPDSGVIRGTSTFVTLASSDPDVAILRPDTFQHVSIDSPRTGGDEEEDNKPRAYPASLMGVIAVVRQNFLDARHQAADHAHFAKNPKGRPRPNMDTSLEALLPAAEKKMPVLFEPASALMVERAAHLAREFDLQPVLLACGQEWRRPELARAVKASFIVPLDFPEVAKMPEDDDWQAVPFETLRAWDHAPGNAALLRREGIDIALTTHGLAKRSSFRANARLAVARGLSADDALAALTTIPAKLCGVADQLGTIEPGKLANLTVVENGGYFDDKSRVRGVWIDGRLFPAALKDDKGSKDAKEERKSLTAAPAQQDRGPLLSSKAVWIKNATIWTCGPKGRLENAGLLIVDGKVKAVGSIEKAPKDAHVIELPGIHVTPGLIDCHSHSMVMGGVNEGTLPSTAMVRVGDVVNSESETIHQQLAGGLTTANLLHGSANPIGGQNCVIKLRDGAAPEDLKLKGAPGGIKFALGENVKQSGWGDAFKSRFPQSRMGVPAFHTNRFTAAQHYMAELAKKDGPPVRRDLELEALAEIIRGERLIHCHSYRQDEILAFLRVMEGFKVRVGTLQHILEGYKVADEIAKHGAGASAFSDWWAYKLEVYDAIPHAGSIMRERGVLVSFNSDSSDHARRMNLEAAKAVKYGGTSEEEALKFVTINPAKQLRIDKQVGSLEPGKDGDFAIWSGHPLSTTSICLQTWIDGKQYFEREAAKRRSEARNTERLALIAKAKKLASSSADEKDGDEKAKARFFFRTLEERQNHLCVDCCMDRAMQTSY
ncbi:MAG: amidohydrolase family protein [Verrucomicrobiaceae bacterium]|nr:amidohydrolase family protein [Verrucomicrobiaceae bacterium]